MSTGEKGPTVEKGAEIIKLARTMVCPFCQAPAKVKCSRPEGGEYPWKHVHARRWHKARRVLMPGKYS